MAKKTFYEILQDKEYTKEAIEKLAFRMDFKGPQYNIIFGDKYSNLMDSIENGDFILKSFTPVEQEIKDANVKKNLLNRLFYNHKNI
jgi:hypothetical protein